jgi:type I restriction enzyme S subunit
MIREDFKKIFGFSNRMTDWKISKIKQIVATKITDGPHETPELVEDGIPFISAEAIKNDHINFELKRGFITEEAHQEYSRKCKPQKNDIFIIKSGATTGNVACVDVDLEFNIWSPLAVVRCDERIADYKFIYYQFLSDIFKKQVSLSWSFGTQENIGMGVIERLNAVYPEVNEQRIISAYLDKQCAAIDKVLEAKREQLTVLEDLRKSIIHKAVTNGLDDSVEMKDSGVEWIGNVPNHWKVKRIKRFAKVKRGASPRPIEDQIYFDEDGEYSWVRISDVTASERYLETTEQRLSELGSSLSVKQYPGDLFISIAGSVGKPIITKIKCCIHDGFIWFEEPQFNKEFLWYVFISEAPYQGLGKLGTQLNLNTATVGQIFIPVPSLKEQAQIVKNLDQKCGEINELKKNIENQIDTLEKYRNSLIHECVTGKRRITEKDLKELANV